jgi:hypothetical protein
MVEAEGLEPAWQQMQAAIRRPGRFERNLTRLLDGFEHDFFHRS